MPPPPSYAASGLTVTYAPAFHNARIMHHIHVVKEYLAGFNPKYVPLIHDFTRAEHSIKWLEKYFKLE